MSTIRTPAGRARNRARSAAWLTVLALVLAALFLPASTVAVDAPGNNGTVKVHDGPNEPAAEVRNEPHVCTFHLHFFFADPTQAGEWHIEEWAPDDKGQLALSGTYDTAGDGEDRQPASGTYSLPNGHYKLFWDGDEGKHDKQKVFWVDCPPATPTPSPTATPTPTPTPTPSPTATPSPTPTPTPTPLPTPTPTPLPTPTPTPLPTPTPTPLPTPTPTPVGTPAATPAVSPTPTPVVTPTPTPLPTPTPVAVGGVLPEIGAPSPTGGVLAEIGGPGVTLPPTDSSDDQASAAASNAWRMVLLLLAGSLATILVLTPAKRRA